MKAVGEAPGWNHMLRGESALPHSERATCETATGRWKSKTSHWLDGEGESQPAPSICNAREVSS